MPEKTICVVGLGAIGSQTAQHIARMAEVKELILVDKDSYEAKNIRSQFITDSDLAKPKASAQSERLSAISRKRRLNIIAICEDIRNVPWGRLKCDVLLSCCDNRIARLYASEIAWRMGTPLVDAGVRKDGLLARVDVYIPNSEEASCYECSFTQTDYEMLEINYPCDNNNEQQIPATDSPSYLGALGASIQAAECAKILAGNIKNAGSRIVISADSYRCYVSRLLRNEQCKFDHEIFEIKKLETSTEKLSVQQILAMPNGGAHHNAPVSLRFRRPFYLLRATCACGHSMSIINLHYDALTSCSSCGRHVTAGELQVLSEIDSSLPRTILEQSIASTGLRSGDIFSLRSPYGERHFEVAGPESNKEDS